MFTAHEVLPPRSRDHVEAWLDVFRSVARIVVHARSSAERLVDLGVEPERIVEIAHPAFEGPGGEPAEAPRGATLLFFGLIRDYKGLDVLIQALPEVVARGSGALASSSPATRSIPSSRCVPWPSASRSPTGSTGDSASSPRTRFRG